LALCCGCAAARLDVTPALTSDGEVYLYLQPLPQEVSSLRFKLQGVSALRSDGVDVPLTLIVADFEGRGSQRQRLMAHGVLPPGSYRGLGFKAARATVRQEEGEKELSTAGIREAADLPFEVRRQQATVIHASLKYRQAVTPAVFNPVFSLAIPDRPLQSLTGYVSCYGSNGIAVFDKRAGEVQQVISTGRGPKSILFDRAAMRAYAVISGNDTVEVIDLANHFIINTIRLNDGDVPGEAALTADGRTLLTANSGSNSVSFIDPTSNFATTRVTVGTGPRSIAIEPSGSRAFVFNTLSNSISIVDIAGQKVTATVPTESAPVRGTFSRKGDRLYVFYEWSPYVLVYDTATLTVSKRLYVGMGVTALKVDSVTDRLYVAKAGSTGVDVYDPFSAIPMDSLAVAGGATYMLIDSDENNLILVIPDQNAVQSINLVSKKERFLMDACIGPYWTAIMDER